LLKEDWQKSQNLKAAARDRISEISNLTGQIEAREREVSTLHAQIQLLQTQIGEKQVLESQLEQLRGQLKEASSTITNLQSQQKVSGALQVDRVLDDSDDELVTDAQLMVENETLHADLSDALREIEILKAALAKTPVSQAESHSESDSDSDSDSDSGFDADPVNSESVEPPAKPFEPVPTNKKQKVALAK
jgi:SMC interacting uncharacterized protein involved in chromosome segregation